MSRGFFGIGVFHTKTEENIGTLLRSAKEYGADFLFTIGKRYQHQCTDTTKAWKSIPLYHYLTFQDFKEHLPFDCRIAGVELADNSVSLPNFVHPERIVYLLGAEEMVLSLFHYFDLNKLLIYNLLQKS